MNLDARAERFEPHRSYLFGVAYRLLGELSAAEDAVQEAFLRFRNAPEDLREPRAWLTTVVTRLCLDELRSARARREVYVGPWLPEPLVSAAGDLALDPAQRVEDVESLSMAMLVVLESLTPLERAVFVLREVFGFDYAELAAMLDKSEAAVRQLAHRAREHVQARRPRFDHDEERRRAAVEQFLIATLTGDVKGLMATLSEDAVLLSDGGGVVQAARKPILGPDRIARFFLGLTAKYMTPAHRAEIATVNGSVGLLLWDGERLDSVIGFDVLDGKVVRVHAVRNPAKLATVASAILGDGQLGTAPAGS